MNSRNQGYPSCPGRRTFLKIAGLTGAGVMSTGLSDIAFSNTQKALESSPPVSSGPPAPVIIATVKKQAADEAIVAAVKRAAEATTDFAWLSKGDTVLIKPVANSPNPYPATTSPLAVKAMAELLHEKGAGKVILGEKPGAMSVYQDKDKHTGSSREVLTATGLHTAAVESGAKTHYFDEAGYDAYTGFTTTGDNHWSGELMLPNILNQVDHVVLLPRVSRHALAGSTLGLKAAVGWLRDDSRLEFHRDADSFFEKIAEINDTTVLREKLRLTLSVATKVLATFGPDTGRVTEPDPGLIIASESLLAHDMVALGWLLWNREYLTPRDRISIFTDPYIGVPSTINRGFVGFMWGMDNWYNYKSYDAPAITSATTDPVIRRAADIFGGLPRVELATVAGELPETIRKYLEEKSAV